MVVINAADILRPRCQLQLTKFGDFSVGLWCICGRSQWQIKVPSIRILGAWPIPTELLMYSNWHKIHIALYPGPAFFNIIFFYLEICNMKCWSKCQVERKETLWSRLLRISLSCWLSTWQVSKMSFSFDQSQPQRYLIHPIIWLVEPLKYIPQSETTVKSWWHENKDPNGLDQKLSFLGSQRFVPIQKIKEAVRVKKFAKKE